MTNLLKWDKNDIKSKVIYINYVGTVRCFTCGSLISDKWTYNDLYKYRTEKQDDIILLDADILQNDSIQLLLKHKP